MSHFRRLIVLAAGILYIPQSPFNKWRKNSFVVNAQVPLESLEKMNLENPDRINEIVKYGLPFRDVLLTNNDFEISYDKRKRQPNWVVEHLTKRTISLEENEDFKNFKCYTADRRVKNFGSNDCDYNRYEFTKGQLAAKRNHEQSFQDYKNTFSYTNISPQHSQFNKGIWADLESYARYLTTEYDDVHVISGPLFLPEGDRLYYQVIGSNHVAVPTHFFKAIICEEDEDDWFKVICYVIPNRNIPESDRFCDYVVKLKDLEKVAGFNIFKTGDDIPYFEVIPDGASYREERRRYLEENGREYY